MAANKPNNSKTSRSPRWPTAAALFAAALMLVLAAWSFGGRQSSQPNGGNQLAFRPNEPAAAPPNGLYADDATAAGQSPTSIRAYNVRPEHLPQTLAELRRVYQSNPAVQLSADQRTSRILVKAPAAVHAQLAARFNPVQAAPSVAAPSQTEPTAQNNTADVAPRIATRHVVALNHTGWTEIHDALRQIWGEKLPAAVDQEGQVVRLELPLGPGETVTLAFDRQTRQVEIQGPTEAATAWSQLIRALDRPARAANQQTQVVALRNAQRQKVQAALAAFQQDAAAKDDNAQLQPGPNGAAANQPDAANEAPPDDDQNLAPGDASPIGPVQVEFLEGLDVIIIRGNPRDVERVAKIIEDIERLSVVTTPEIRVYQLAHVNNEALASLIAPLYDQVLQARQGRVSITALGKPNALLLIGRADSVEAVVALIQQLDRPVPPATQLHVFQLQHQSAIVAEDTIRQFYEERGGLGPQIRVLSDFRSNAVIVQAAPRDMAEIAALVRKIDVVRAKSVNEVRVFRLTNSLAEDLALVLQQAIQGDETTRGGLTGGLQGALTGQGGTTQNQPRAPGQGLGQQLQPTRSAILTLKTLDPAGQQILRSGILADVRVTADLRANALVVTGPPENMELIGELIRQLDQLPSAEAQLKVFTIINADATSLVQVLEDLFGQQGGAGQTTQQVGLEESIVPLRFSVDQRTNSIIVSGAGSDLEVVEAILLRLDESDIDERKNTVYRLNNAPAVDVANAVNEFLRSQREVQQIAPEGTSPFEQIEREVIVVPEPVNNSLIISATPRYYDEIMRLIQDLDKRPPMVMIQVMIAEVRLNDFDEMGFELGVQDSLLFDRSTVLTAMNDVLDPGFNFNNQDLGNSSSAASVATRDHFAPQVLSSFGVSRTNSDLGYGGLVISGGNDEVSILIRALQDDRRVDILSRPQVMTLDNQPAFIQVGQRVPRIVSSQVVEGAVINSTTLENVGIILGVTPRISPDGLVVMEIDAEKSRLGAEEDGIPISINANGQVIRSPIIDTIVAQTTVSAVSGQTVILGGLITKDDQLIARRVPYLSEIPIVGSLFRFDTADHRRSELLFIMTPYVVRDEGDVEMIKQMESQRMSWCLSDVVAIHGDVNLSSNGNSHVACWDHGPTKVIYPDLLPTVPEPLEIAPPEPLPAPQIEPPLTPNPTPPPVPAPGNTNTLMLRPTPLDAPPPDQSARYTTAPPPSIPAGANQWQTVAPTSYQGPTQQVYSSGAWQRLNVQQR